MNQRPYQTISEALDIPVKRAEYLVTLLKKCVMEGIKEEGIVKSAIILAVEKEEDINRRETIWLSFKCGELIKDENAMRSIIMLKKLEESR